MSGVVIEREVPPQDERPVTAVKVVCPSDRGTLEFYRDDAVGYVGVKLPGYGGTWASLKLVEVAELTQGLTDILDQKKQTTRTYTDYRAVE